MSDALHQLDAFVTPGTLLRLAREGRGMTQREAADQLHLMPDYVGILERDDYQALRRPAFARGYLRAYARLVNVDEHELLDLFEKLHDGQSERGQQRVVTRPLQLQRTGAGVAIGLAVLSVLVAVLWFWQGDRADTAPVVEALAPSAGEAQYTLDFGAGDED